MASCRLWQVVVVPAAPTSFGSKSFSLNSFGSDLLLFSEIISFRHSQVFLERLWNYYDHYELSRYS